MTVDGPDHGEVRTLGPRADRGDRRRVGFGLDDHLVHVAMVPTQGRRKPWRDRRRGVGRVRSVGLGITARTRPTSDQRPGSKPPGSRTSVIDRAASSARARSAPPTRRHRCPAAARRTPATPGVRRVAVPTRPNHPCGTTPSPPHIPAPPRSARAPGYRRRSAAGRPPPRSPRPHRGCRPARGPPAMSRASVMETPSKPSSPRSRSVMTARDSVAGTSFAPSRPATRCARTSPRAHLPPLPHRTGRARD